MSVTFTPFRPRIIRSAQIVTHEGYVLKTYTVHRKGDEFRRSSFDEGLRAALASLPRPGRTSVRPGLGFVILHQGRGAQYVIVCWWDHENELPMHVFVDTGSGWKRASNHESICVWDIEIIWYERQTYIATMLSGSSGDEQAYLRFTFKPDRDD